MCKKKEKNGNGNNMGRPPIIDEEKAKTIITLVKAGNYVETAAAYVGICKQTLYNLMKKGARSKSGKAKDFLDSIKAAEAEADARDLRNILNAAKTSWQASAWRLERKNYMQWGRRSPDKNMIEPEEVDTLVRNVILAINRTITDKGERSALAEEIARMGAETKLGPKNKHGVRKT